MGSFRVLIVGAGAVGAFYGGKLAQAGATVSVVCRSNYEVVRCSGFDVRSVWGDFSWQPDQVCRSVSDYMGKLDLVIVTTKVMPGDDVASLLAGDAIQSGTVMMVLQNGMFIEAAYRDVYPGHEILSGLAFVCVTQTEPGKIWHQDYGMLAFGRYPDGQSEMAERLATLWGSVDVKCQVSESIQRSRWEKLVWNAPFNPLSVIKHATTAELLADSDTESRIRRIMAEICDLAAVDGYVLDDGIIDLKIEQTRRMTPYKTSMLLDYDQGKPIEREAILGNAIQFAAEKGVAVPELTTLYGKLGSVGLF